MISAVLFLSFFVFLIMGIPISICLGLSSVCAILYSGTSLTIVATNMYSGISKFLLLAIPFFVLSGNIMAKAGISRRLINFVNTCVGHRRGGIAIVCVIVACFFGAISGSGPATVAALGCVLIPAMIQQGGFSAPFSTALMATASSIAIVIPPSIAFVVYASITGVSIADMFMGGIVPGILMGLALVIVVMIEVRKNNIQGSMKKASGAERWAAFKDAFWGLLMPVIILGGIYGGIFTPTEAAAVSVVYGLFVGMVVYREITVKDLWALVIDSAKTTGGIMLIVACASLFSFVCTKFGIAQAASDLLGSIAHNQFTFLLIVNVIFLIAGCFIDANSAMYIFIPIMLPVCKQLGYDVVAFGIVATVNLAIGQVTPPVGVNLFVAISVKLKNGDKVDIPQISKAVMPMIVASVIVLAAITYVPSISTFLPKALAGDGAYTGNPTVSSDNGSSSLGEENAAAFNDIDDYSDLGWEEQTWNFTCSTTETSTWADGGRKFGELMEKATGGNAIMMTTSHNPDIMLLDLGLPDIDGIEVIRSVRTWSNLPIIVLSARSEDSDKIEALDNGADDYLTKPFSVDELLARLRVTQRRLNLLASDGINSPVFVNGPLKIDFSAGCVWLSENELHLTPIEYKLLCVLAHNVGKVLTHTSLTQKVWGSTQENDIASLRVYMASLRKKLERNPDAPHLIQTHVGVGYRMLRAENDEAS